MVRITKGVSQQELADRINRTRPLISHIEQTGKVNDRTLALICKALKVSESDIENFVNEPKNNYKNSRQSNIDIFDKIDSLTEEVKTLKELVQSQKEIIELLRANKKTKK